MTEVADISLDKQTSLRAMAKRNSMFSLLLFLVLVGIVFVAFQRDKASMGHLEEVYQNQFQIEQFKASLFDVMSELNDFTLTASKESFPKLKQAVKDYEGNYAKISAIPVLTADHKSTLTQVHSLMSEVMNNALAVADGKIPAGQASTMTILSQNLVIGAQTKLELIVRDLEKTLNTASAERAKAADMQFYLVLALIVLIIVILEVLNRKLLAKAEEVSKATSSVASSVGDILTANQEQADASGQQSRFIEKVVKGLELIAESGSKITTTTASMEKTAGGVASFAQGGASEMDNVMASITTIRNGVAAQAEKSEIVSQKSDQVLKSLDQVVEVTDEAQLLAVNASIDGDTGAITDEVQRLADQIRQISEEIRGVVTELQGSAQAASGEISTNSQEIDNCEGIARQVSDLLVKAKAMAEKTGQSAGMVTQATERQNERSLKILQALKHISELLNISGSKLQASQDASERLNKASESLQNMS